MPNIDEIINKAAERAADKAVDRILRQNVPAAEYLTTVQTAAYLSLSRQQLEIWRSKGGGPRYVKLDQSVRYKRSALDDFMAARERNHTAEG